jgi:hypothetical protein
VWRACFRQLPLSADPKQWDQLNEKSCAAPALEGAGESGDVSQRADDVPVRPDAVWAIDEPASPNTNAAEIWTATPKPCEMLYCKVESQLSDSPIEGAHAMNQRQVILLSLAASAGAVHTIVQIHRIVYLIQQRLADELGGAAFEFNDDLDGPFAPALYQALCELEDMGLLERSITARGWAAYKLAPAAQRNGKYLLATVPDHAAAFVREASSYVRASFLA